MNTHDFSPTLQSKIDSLTKHRKPIELGSIKFASPLIMAPMASICNVPFRLLMEDLGAGGTVSELISCHGINHGNDRTMKMLRIDKREKNVGIQLFGEDGLSIARSCEQVLKQGPKFIDINMGCPVRKVVTKGGGSALLKEPKLLIPFLKEIKSAIDIPLTIKIRTGWDNENVNASEIVKVAADCGVEFVAIHGRTRTQQYTGKANWEYLESLNDIKEIPLVGNGDLHQPAQVIKRMKNTKMDALMIARGAIRNPFIFLESYQGLDAKQSLFSGEEYWEVIQRLYIYTTDAFSDERICLVQMRKLIVWFAAGFKGAAKFRGLIFATKTLPDCMKVTEDYFLSLDSVHKYINYDEVFMSSGHG